MKKPEKQPKERRYSKEGIIKSKKFANHHDILSALLKDNQTYTLKEVEGLVRHECH